METCMAQQLWPVHRWEKYSPDLCDTRGRTTEFLAIFKNDMETLT